ncbi:MAG: recombination mediator RecR [Candidatus Methylomirabilaceae bacterium]
MGELVRLPGIGPKSAQRLAFHLLKAPKEEALALAQSIIDLKERARSCIVCCNVSEDDRCNICADAHRDGSLLCVVEEAHDLWAIEKTGGFKGMYHVLGGSLSPLDGRGPDRLTAKALLRRLEAGEVKEIILATNPNVEGEATAMYLSRLLRPLSVRVTRLARGLPMGGDLEYADEVTLSKAIEGRRDI